MARGTAAGSIFGSLMGNKMQQDQFGNQLTLMKKQHEYNEASANAAQERAYEMWDKTNYPAQVEQMKEANLSPALMYGQGGAGGGTVSGAQGQGTSQPTEQKYRDWETDRKSTRLNSSHITRSRMPSSA